MAETNAIVLDNFSDGGAKWAFYGDAGVTHNIAASAVHAGTALGNVSATQTLAYTFTTPAPVGGPASYNCSIRCTLPAPVDVSALAYICADLWFTTVLESGQFSASPTLQWYTDTGHLTLGIFPAGDDWTIGRTTVAALVAAAGDAKVASIQVNLYVLPGVTATVYVDTLRACNYVYSADDMRLFGRRPGLATNAQVDTLMNQAMAYLFGNTTGQPTGTPAGIQMDATQPNFGAFRNYNPFSGAEIDASAAGPEADMDTVGGAMVQGLVMMYRMTGLSSYMTAARWFIYNFWIKWTDLRSGSISYGFMPYSVSLAGARNADVSSDNYQMAIMGIVDFWIADGRQDTAIVNLISAWWTWWRQGQITGHYYNYAGTDITGFGSLGAMPGILWAAKNFMASGDAGGDLDSNGNPQGQTAFADTYDPALFSPSYRTDYLAVGGHTTWGLGYNTVTLREPIVMNRWSRTKLSVPVANFTTLVQENWLAQAVGAPYYNTDLPGDFNKRGLMAFCPTEAAALWNSTTKLWGITAQGPTDGADTAGAQEDVHYLVDALRDLPGGDVGSLIAAGTTEALSVLGTLDTLIRETASKGLIAPGQPWDSIPVRALRGIYAWYTNNQGVVRNGWLTTMDFHTVGHLVGIYAWWYQYFRFVGLWPEIAGRVLDWRYSPALGGTRFLVNGNVGDVVSIVIHGMQGGHTYRLQNLTSGAAPATVAGSNPYTLTWTLANVEETWLVGDVATLPAISSGAAAPVGGVALNDAVGDVAQSPLWRGLGSASEPSGGGAPISSVTEVA